MFKHQLLMALDEARVDSRQCFLKSSPIMPFYLRTCVDTYGCPASVARPFASVVPVGFVGLGFVLLSSSSRS